MLAAAEMGMRSTLVLMKTLQPLQRCGREFGRARQESSPWHMQDMLIVAWKAGGRAH